jgi:hypothetical protein
MPGSVIKKGHWSASIPAILICASSLVEMVNSLMRPYLNSCKGQITQEALNLIMFYHNHHRYKSGKREGKAPFELLTGESFKADSRNLGPHPLIL